MAKSMGHVRDSRALSWLSDPRTDAPNEPPLKGPSLYHTKLCKSSSRSDLQYFFWRPCWPVHHNSFFTTYNKMKTKNITLSEKFQKFNRKIVVPRSTVQRRCGYTGIS
jgi:hypothetical protein